MTIFEARLKHERKQFRQRLKDVEYPETDANLTLEKTTYALFADCMQIKVPHLSIPMKSDSKRGKVVGFSRASRLNMKKKLAKMPLKGKYPFFLTLTYPELYSDNIRTCKRDIDVFRKAFARAFDSFIGGFWRLEMQRRGAPHFHMLLISDSPVSMKKIISFCHEKWPNIVRTSYLNEGHSEKAYQKHYERHKHSGHNVQFMKSRRMVCNYISKYISKEDDTVYPDGTGRIWGKWQFNGHKLDFTAEETGTLERDETVYLKRMVRKHKEASNRLSLSQERQLRTGEIASLKEQKTLQKKLRQHKSDKKYAKRIARQNTITLFGYGTESENGAVIEKMLSVARLRYAESLFSEELENLRRVSVDLINPHISPRENAIRDGDVESVESGVRKLAVGGLVDTVDGPGVVLAIVEDVGKLAIRLDRRTFDGGRLVKLYDYDAIGS